jgi:hypothetical protein
MEGATETTTTTTTTTHTETKPLMDRNDLVAIVNALLLFASEHLGRRSFPRLSVVWENARELKEVTFFWQLDRTSVDRDANIRQWEQQCEELKKCLTPHYDATSIRLSQDWAECQCIIRQCLD